MIEYRPDKRLYVLGGGLTVAQAIRPAAAPPGGWWDVADETCVAAYQAKGAASYAASLVNLANPGTYDLTTSDAPTWDTSTGWTFTASGDQLATGWVPTSGCTVIVRMVVGFAKDGSNAVDATDSPAIVFNIVPLTASNEVRYRIGSFNTNITGVGSTGAHVVGIAGADAYYDGADIGNIITTGGWPTTGTMYIGNREAGNRALGGSIQALAMYSTTLDASQMAALTTAMNAL